ncbi:MAG: DUF1573 domain-containing protein [Sedimentisphaerales bacterium]|nr:DUF1573 domain-containing protein [Sedimentisphaerales bacterium]
MLRKRFSMDCLVVSCIVFLQIGCQEQANLSLSQEPPDKVAQAPDLNRFSPRITFKKWAFDFGDVSPNSVLTGEITFTNTGQAPLKITKIEKCCGVVAKLDKDKNEYAPGETGTLNIQWGLGPEPGAFQRQLVVHSNDNVNPVASLSLHAKTVLRIAWEPKRFRLSPVEANAGCPELIIRSLDDRSFSITRFQSTGDCMTADFDRSVNAKRHVIQPKVRIEKLQKYLSGRINIRTTHPEGHAATFLFDVLPEYTIEPPSILVFNAEPGKSLMKKIVLRNNYGNDFEIDSVSSKNSPLAIEVLGKTKIDKGYRLDVEINVPPAAGKTKFTDNFYITLTTGEKLPLQCNGYYSKRSPESQN